jgi:hypothetical protein
MKQAPRLRVVRRAADELSDQQIEQLMAFGKREAELLDQMEEATRAGDRDAVWRLATSLLACQDEVRAMGSSRAALK